MDYRSIRIKYLAAQFEEGEKTQRLHIQGYIETYDSTTRSQLQRRLGVPGMHMDPRLGTRAQARDYALKQDNDWYHINYPDWGEKGARKEGTIPLELGVWKSQQGRRTDLEELCDAIHEEPTELAVYLRCPSQYIKYSTGIKRARSLLEQRRVLEYIPNLETHIFYGHTRSGKTRETLKNGHQNMFCPIWNGQKFWFDGYDGQEILLLDEFTGQCTPKQFQRLLDHYVIRLESKGDTVVSNWTKIYITSNLHPEQWFDNWFGVAEEIQQSIMERITSIKKCKSLKKRQKLSWSDLEFPKKAGRSRPVLPSSATSAPLHSRSITSELPEQTTIECEDAQSVAAAAASLLGISWNSETFLPESNVSLQKISPWQKSKMETAKTCNRHRSEDRARYSQTRG